MSVYVAKVFMNGRSQAVRLPKDCRFNCNEVYVHKLGEGVFITPRKPTWDHFFDQETAFGDDFLPSREETPPQDRDF